MEYTNFKQKSLKELQKMSAVEYEVYLSDMEKFIKMQKKENAKKLKIEKEIRDNARNKEFFLSIKKIFEKANIKANSKDMIRTLDDYFNYETNRNFLKKSYEAIKNEKQ